MSAVVMIWLLIECPWQCQVWGYFFEGRGDDDTFKTPVNFEVIAE
jgi:hypothetical protein